MKYCSSKKCGKIPARNRDKNIHHSRLRPSHLHKDRAERSRGLFCLLPVQTGLGDRLRRYHLGLLCIVPEAVFATEVSTVARFGNRQQALERRQKQRLFTRRRRQRIPNNSQRNQTRREDREIAWQDSTARSRAKTKSNKAHNHRASQPL